MNPRTLPYVIAPSPWLLRALKQQNSRCFHSSKQLCRAAQSSISGDQRQARQYSGSEQPRKDVKLLCAPRIGWNHPARSFDGGSSTYGSSQDLHGSGPSALTLGQGQLLRQQQRRRLRRSSTDASRPFLAKLFSSSPLPRLWRLFGWERKEGRPRPLPPLASFIDDAAAPGRMLKATNEPRIRCTEFDESGNVTLVNGEFKKSELIAKYGLLPRDLRKIDSSLLPHMLIRPSAILINLLHLRVLIKHNRVLVFDAYGSTDSYTQSVFMYDLEGKLRQMDSRANGALPYELRALEAVLISATNGLESEFEGVREPVVRVLRELEEDIDREKLRYLLIYSKKLSSFEQTARLVRDALDELLEADDDLAAMYLTEKANGKGRSENEHTEVEMLLESYHKVTDEIVQAAENLVSSIRNTEEIVKAILDANRNALMLLELRFSVWTLGLGAGTFLAALYGMNLKNFIEESDLGFWGVSGISAAVSILVLAYGLRRLRRVQRVSMWGDHCPPANRSPMPVLHRNAQLEQVRADIRAEERGSLWGIGGREPLFRRDQRPKKPADRGHTHPEGPLFSKRYSGRGSGAEVNSSPNLTAKPAIE